MVNDQLSMVSGKTNAQLSMTNGQWPMPTDKNIAVLFIVK